jgi:hypothetical protein
MSGRGMSSIMCTEEWWKSLLGFEEEYNHIMPVATSTSDRNKIDWLYRQDRRTRQTL